MANVALVGCERRTKSSALIPGDVGGGVLWIEGPRHLLVLLVFVAFHVFAALGFFAQPLLGAAGWWQIGAGTVAAASLMGWYLWRGHPLLRRELREIQIGEAPGSV